jgi:hypothetical protein
MRFKEFLAEREFNSLPVVLQKIKTNCVPFLNQSRGELMYRGMARRQVIGTEHLEINQGVARYTVHPQNRPPLHSGKHPYFNFVFNAGCELAFGVENLRRQSVFATGAPSQAMQYGDIYLCFPAGDISFISSSRVYDSFEDAGIIKTEVVNNLIGRGHGITMAKLRQGFDKLSASMTPTEWLKESEEVKQLTASSFDIDDEGLYDALRTSLKDGLGSLYDSDNLADHIKRGNEILFHETHGYYSIPVKMFMEEMMARGISHYGDDLSDKVHNFIKNYVSEFL